MRDFYRITVLSAENLPEAFHQQMKFLKMFSIPKISGYCFSKNFLSETTLMPVLKFVGKG